LELNCRIYKEAHLLWLCKIIGSDNVELRLRWLVAPGILLVSLAFILVNTRLVKENFKGLNEYNLNQQYFLNFTFNGGI
jgi:hypothetical protein